MSNLDAVIKVADQLVTRLFDQRQFTHGEINYLVKEFDQQFNIEQNFDKLLKINENVCLLDDKYSGDLGKPYDISATDVGQKVTKLLERTQAILSAESSRRAQSDEIVRQERDRLQTKMEQCLSECNNRLEKLRESIVEEESDLERKYLKFEESLRN